MVGYLGSVTRTTYDPFFVKTLYMTGEYNLSYQIIRQRGVPPISPSHHI